MKKAIVSGASGFIGSNVVNELQRQNIQVIAVIKDENENLDRITDKDKLRVVYCDLSKFDLLPELISDRDIDVFYHFAWMGVSDHNQSNYEVQLQNVNFSMYAINSAAKMGCKKFIGAGSLHELEGMQELSMPIPSYNKGNFYKTAKLAAHYMCKVQAASLGINFIWPIITNTFGVGENSPRLINTLIKKCLKGEEMSLTDGTQYYDFIYITDTARAFFLLGEKGVSFHNYMIGSGVVKPLKEFLTEARDIVNKDIRLGFGEHPFTGVKLPAEVYNITSLKNDTGFEPTITFENGILLTSEWIKSK